MAGQANRQCRGRWLNFGDSLYPPPTSAAAAVAGEPAQAGAAPVQPQGGEPAQAGAAPVQPRGADRAEGASPAAPKARPPPPAGTKLNIALSAISQARCTLDEARLTNTEGAMERTRAALLLAQSKLVSAVGEEQSASAKVAKGTTEEQAKRAPPKAGAGSSSTDRWPVCDPQRILDMWIRCPLPGQELSQDEVEAVKAKFKKLPDGNLWCGATGGRKVKDIYCGKCKGDFGNIKFWAWYEVYSQNLLDMFDMQDGLKEPEQKAPSLPIAAVSARGGVWDALEADAAARTAIEPAASAIAPAASAIAPAAATLEEAGPPKPRTFRQVALAVQALVRLNVQCRRQDRHKELKADFDIALRDAACLDISRGGQVARRNAVNYLRCAADAVAAISQVPGVYLDCLPKAKAIVAERTWVELPVAVRCMVRIDTRRRLRGQSPADASFSEGSNSERPFLRHRKPFGGPTHLRVPARTPPVKQVMEESAPKDAKCSACQLRKSRFHYGHTLKAGFCRWLSTTVPAASATVPATSAIAPATSAIAPAAAAIVPARERGQEPSGEVASVEEDRAPLIRRKKRGQRGRGHQSARAQEWRRTRRRGQMRSPAARSRTKSPGQEGCHFGPRRPAPMRRRTTRCRPASTQRGRTSPRSQEGWRRRGCTSRSSERGRACDRAQGCRRPDRRIERGGAWDRAQGCRRADGRRGERDGACDRAQGRRRSDSRDSRSRDPPFNVFDRDSFQLRSRSDMRR